MIYSEQKKIKDAYSIICEVSDTYTTHGITFNTKPTSTDKSSWIDHGSFRNRPIVMTKDTPTTWADDTKMAAKMTADTISLAAPVPGAGTAKVASVVGKAAKPVITALKGAGKAATPIASTVGKIAKPAASAIGKGAVAVGKSAAKGAGKVAVAVAKPVAKTAAKVGGAAYLGKKGIDYAVDKIKNAGNEAGKIIVDGAKKLGGAAMAHPYVTAGALVAAPLVAYGAKKAYDYFKNKGKNAGKSNESVDESSFAIDESVLDGIIESMEHKGCAYVGADDNGIVFDNNGKRFIFDTWEAVEESVSETYTQSFRNLDDAVSYIKNEIENIYALIRRLEVNAAIERDLDSRDPDVGGAYDKFSGIMTNLKHELVNMEDKLEEIPSSTANMSESEENNQQNNGSEQNAKSNIPKDVARFRELAAWNRGRDGDMWVG